MLFFRLLSALVIWLGGNSVALAVQVGHAREDVIKEKGRPVSVAEAGDRSILTFSDGTVVTLVNRRVTQVSSRPVYPATAAPAKRPATGGGATSNPAGNWRIFLAAGAGILAAILLAPLFFRGPGDFGEAVRYSMQPDWISLFRGEWIEDQWASLKIIVWLALSFGTGYSLYHVLG